MVVVILLFEVNVLNRGGYSLRVGSCLLLLLMMMMAFVTGCCWFFSLTWVGMDASMTSEFIRS